MPFPCIVNEALSANCIKSGSILVIMPNHDIAPFMCIVNGSHNASDKNNS